MVFLFKVCTSIYNCQYLWQAAVMDIIEKSWRNTDTEIPEILFKRLGSGNDDSFFVFNAENVKQKVNFWNEPFPRVNPFYAMKTNHSDVAIRTMANLVSTVLQKMR